MSDYVAFNITLFISEKAISMVLIRGKWDVIIPPFRKKNGIFNLNETKI